MRKETMHLPPTIVFIALSLPSSLSSLMQVSDYKAAFTSMHLLFLELDTNDCRLNFRFLDEDNKAVSMIMKHIKSVMT